MTFEVEGEHGASRAGVIVQSVGLDMKEKASVPLPYRRTVQVSGHISALSLWALRDPNAADSLTCRIKVDGRAAREATSDGPLGMCRIEIDLQAG
ncbi:hypothetical protein [Planotetraspora phitsanulokensis]|uniref:Uncharacterized protein n=1 Tax=Planotetraspora phitsanulokensis TaxID=575192 RepID=A0A8J3UEX1_9ACTN|nr:hypothetical protein [Planotetraspora phitsanulokensis]GII42417.1 hypothetical protein Pph01_74200 [Planotetraspora phitsanulokensis]